MGEIASRWAEQLVGRTLAGRYAVSGLLGLGGMGAVLRATQIAIRREVALKVLMPIFADRADATERFRREAMLASQVSASGTVAVLDFDRDPDVGPFLVMERLHGESLEALLARERTLAVSRALDVVTAILATLSSVHERGIVHRDLKPANVFLTDQGEVKILDFGVARLMGPSEDGLTQPGALLGTPRYMAREQALGLEVDARADLYAVGAILYRALGGAAPYAELSVDEGLAALGTGQAPTPLATLRPELPPGLYAVVERAMAESKHRRFADASAMRDALARPLDVVPEELPVTRTPSTARGSVPATVSVSGVRGFEEPSPPAHEPADIAVPDPTPPSLLASSEQTLASAATAGGTDTGSAPRSRVALLAGVGAAVGCLAAVVVYVASASGAGTRPGVAPPRAEVYASLSAARGLDDGHAAARLDDLLRVLPPKASQSPEEREIATEIYLVQGRVREHRVALPDGGAPTDSQKKHIAEGAEKARNSYGNANAARYAACAEAGRARVALLEAIARDAGVSVQDHRREALAALDVALKKDASAQDPWSGRDCTAEAGEARARLEASF